MLRAMSSKRCLSAALALGIMTLTTQALAEQDPNGRGIIGGALLGAELTVAGEAVAGVRPTWAYFVGGTLGAGVGAGAGFVVEENASLDASLILLAAGIALVIPTTIFVANWTEDKPPPPESVQLLWPRMRVERAASGVSLDFLNGRF
jgi:hypothetical protein